MKTLKSLIGMAGGLAVLLAAGCQPSDTAAPESSSPPEAVETQTPAPKESVAEPQTPTLEESVAETTETAKQVIGDANAKAQELLTQAQTLVSEKKYEEAGNLLQKLSEFELTPEQQKMLENLKESIQKALESDAVKQGTKAIGNMLGGEK